MRSYLTEFPDFPFAHMPAIPKDFEDTSLQGEKCPSFTCRKLGIKIMVAMPKKPAPRAKRPVFVLMLPYGAKTETDDFGEVLQAIAARRAELD